MKPKVSKIKEKIYSPAEEYYSPNIDEFLALEDPVQTARIETRMMLAKTIADTIKERGISKKELAQRLGQHPSAVTKWLSGKHNFTSDTLADIGRALEINLFAHDIPVKELTKEFVYQPIVIQTPNTNLEQPKWKVSNNVQISHREINFA